MFSLKTKNRRPRNLFLIALIVGGSALALSSQFIVSSKAASVVKDDSIVAPSVSEEQGSGAVENLNQQDDKPVITTYVVRRGDSLSSIASKFSISTNTILWANDLNKKSVIKEGQKLTILPVSGIVYTVAKGDTLGGIALKFDADVDEIISFNDLEDSKKIKLGMKLIVPNAELPKEKIAQPEKVVVKKVETPVVATKKVDAPVAEVKPDLPKTEVATDIDGSSKTVVETDSTSKGYFKFPIPGAILTQGVHGYNGVDFGAPVGTTVLAAASGKVIVAKASGYNGGYGKYVVIEHDNGTQTLYGHLSNVLVVVDDEVTKGDKIALSGNTGRSTGPHLHFEVRGAANPFAGIKKGTQF